MDGAGHARRLRCRPLACQTPARGSGQTERGPGGRAGCGDSVRPAGCRGPGGGRQRNGQGVRFCLWRRMAPVREKGECQGHASCARLDPGLAARQTRPRAAAAWDSLRRAASTGAHDGRLRGSRGQALCVGPRRRRPAAGLAPKIDSASRPNLPRVKIDSPSGVQPAPRQAPSTTRVDLETGSAFSRRGHSSRPIYMPDL